MVTTTILILQRDFSIDLLSQGLALQIMNRHRLNIAHYQVRAEAQCVRDGFASCLRNLKKTYNK